MTTLPPRWFIRTAWVVHRAIYRVSGGHVGLSLPTPGGRFGMLQLTAIGRRTGEKRSVILGYYEVGQDLVTLAMNGWGDAAPAWWLNLQAQPDAHVMMKTGGRAVRARAAEGEERDRLWAGVAEYGGYGDDIDGLAAQRSAETVVVVLEPR